MFSEAWSMRNVVNAYHTLGGALVVVPVTYALGRHIHTYVRGQCPVVRAVKFVSFAPSKCTGICSTDCSIECLKYLRA